MAFKTKNKKGGPGSDGPTGKPGPDRRTPACVAGGHVTLAQYKMMMKEGSDAADSTAAADDEAED